MTKRNEQTLLKKHILKLLNNNSYDNISCSYSSEQKHNIFAYTNNEYEIKVDIKIDRLLNKIWYIKIKVDDFIILNKFKMFCNKTEKDIFYHYVDRKIKPKFDISKYIPNTDMRIIKINKLRKSPITKIY